MTRHITSVTSDGKISLFSHACQVAIERQASQLPVGIDLDLIYIAIANYRWTEDNV